MQKKLPKKITQKMTISDIIEKYPKTIDVFLELGIFCFGCSVAKFETLGQGLSAHGFSNQDIDKIIKKLNEKIK
jgi:hybrid cluster-associated redox disulfide protein